MLLYLRTKAEIDIGNAIECAVKTYQVKTTIVKCTKVRVKGLKFKRSQKDIFV